MTPQEILDVVKIITKYSNCEFCLFNRIDCRNAETCFDLDVEKLEEVLKD